jgi:hypothetical protein
MGKTGVISNKKLCRGKVFGCVKDKITQIPVLWVLSHPKHLSLVTFIYYVSMFIPQKKYARASICENNNIRSGKMECSDTIQMMGFVEKVRSFFVL